MRRAAFKMKIKPGFKEEYKRRHDELWPEIAALIKEKGIREYSIFFDQETNYLFACQLIDGENDSQEIKSDVLQRWWDYMADIMEVNDDNSPVSTKLEEVFYIK